MVQTTPLINFPETGDPRFYTILGEMALTHAKKSQDYGTDRDALTNLRNSEEFGIPAWVGTAIRMNDKMKRIQAMASKGSLANESLEDSFLDMASYAVLALILFRETQEKKSP